MFITQLIILFVGTLIIIFVSWSSLNNIQNHGFYRFFAWESILIMFALNVRYWLKDPFSIQQIVAWVFLVISLVLIFQGVKLFLEKGEIDKERENSSLIGIEKTTELITTGVYKYIRHPFYSSLLFLGWGILFKQITWVVFLLSIVVVIFLYVIAKKEEAENV